MRVKEVIITRMAGARLRTVNSRKSWTKRPVAVGPPWPKSNDRVWARAGSATAIIVAARSKLFMKY
jgi:hypothetical protein